MAKRLRFHMINPRHEIVVFIHEIVQCSQVQYLSNAMDDGRYIAVVSDNWVWVGIWLSKSKLFLKFTDLSPVLKFKLKSRKFFLATCLYPILIRTKHTFLFDDRHAIFLKMHGQVAYFNKSFTYFLQGLKNCALQIERLLHPNVQATASKHVTMDSCGYRLCRYIYRNRFFLRQKCFILYLLKKNPGPFSEFNLDAHSRVVLEILALWEKEIK